VQSTYAITILLLLLSSLSAKCQHRFTAGNSYFSDQNYIEYLAGNSPLIVSVPHGGTLKPTELPDRDCETCTYVLDLNTQELARAIAKAVYEQWGCYPHLIINRLHRIKLDANRDITEAADGNPIAEKAWEAYQMFTDSAKASVVRQFQKGIYIDLHGHGHTAQRLELGYLLTKNELQQKDSLLNTPDFINESSFKSLINDNLKDASHAALLRGDYAIGTLLAQQGFPSVPSKQDYAPKTADPYFNGGFNTLRNGSKTEGKIDAFQIESNYVGVRDNANNRKRFADSLTMTLRRFMTQYYFDQFPSCKSLSTEKTSINSSAEVVMPNPFCDYFELPFEPKPNMELTLYELDGKKIWSHLIIEKRVYLPDSVPFGKLLIGVKENDKKIFSALILRKCL
jgi:hypothetical protein